MAHFVLDQNFPWQAVDIPWPPSVQVTHLYSLDRQLTANHGDWEVLLALHRRGDVDGFITNDSAMLDLDLEMTVLSRTRLALVALNNVGREPIVATGLIMVYLEHIGLDLTDQPCVYRIGRGRVGTFRHKPAEFIVKIAQRQQLSVRELQHQALRSAGLPLDRARL